MPKPSSNSKPPKDPNQLAAFIVAQSTVDRPPATAPEPVKEKNPAAVALGRLGGLKGGKARAESLTDEQRKEIATKAAISRWRRQK